ncbi:MAG: transcriptional regulator [Alphaproteobacteria bacterium HGW-Alphaproteobacteria-2]|nr:MAG: transcriptional regulator [Alphaproteobacteria bacterium HGW-Alphaproteobacteria-2]
MDRLAADRMFVAVMETGSFAAAAQMRGASPGQASKLVSRLEATLGVRLLNRTTRALAPTAAGRAYFERIRALLDDLDDLDAALREDAAAPRGRLRLTAPEVEFTDRVARLVEEGFDAAIRIGRPEDSSLIARRLCDMRMIVLAAPDYLSRHGHPSTPGDLAGHACIVDTNLRDREIWRFHGPGGPVSVTVRGRLRYSSPDACLDAAEAGLGIARSPEFVAAPSLAAGRTLSLLEDFEEPPFGVFALWPPGRHLAGAVRALVDFLAERYRSPPSGGEPG